MGSRAGEAWRTARAPVRNPFRHPALYTLATQWRQAFIAAALLDRSSPRQRGR
jgi:hypothetical protein